MPPDALQVQRLDARDPDFETAFRRFLGSKRESPPDVSAAVSEILQAVRRQGDAAVLACGQRFDRVSLTPESLRFTDQEITEAESACSAEGLSRRCVWRRIASAPTTSGSAPATLLTGTRPACGSASAGRPSRR